MAAEQAAVADATEEFDNEFAEFSSKKAGEADAEAPQAPEPEVTPAEVEEVTNAAKDESVELDPSVFGDNPEVWKDASPEQLEEYQKLHQRWRSDAGRQSAYQREINRLKEQAAAHAAPSSQSEPSPTAEQVQAATESDEGWESFTQDFPEYANALSTRLSKLESTLTERIDRQEQQRSQEQREQFLQAQFEQLASRHNDWETVIESDDYRSWLEIGRAFYKLH